MVSREYPHSSETAQACGDEGSGVLEAFVTAGDGTSAPLSEIAGRKAPAGGYLWLHLHLDGCTRLVTEGLDLHPTVVRSLLAAETRPRCRHVLDGVLINLRGVNLNEGDRPEDMLSVRCWLERDRLITVRKRASRAIEEIRDRYRSGAGHSHPGELLIEIIRGLMDRIDPVVDGMADSMDDLERLVLEFGCTDELLDRISSMRHDAIIYRRYLAPMRDAIARLGMHEGACFEKKDLGEIAEETDRAMRVVEELDIVIERARVLADQMAADRADRLNRNMMVLSVVSVVFLPLGFLTGLLGVNVGGIPGAESPYGFAVVAGICAITSFVAAAYFKARDWL